MSIGEKIKTIRKQKGITQKKLGELCGIAEPTIRRYEAEKLNPKIETIERVAAALGVPAFELIGADYWDKKYPDIAKESAEYKGFIDYLHSLGYIVNQVYEACKIPIEEVSDELKDEANGQGFLEGETFHLELIKEGKNTTLDEEDFKQLQTETKDSIAFKLWQKSKDK